MKKEELEKAVEQMKEEKGKAKKYDLPIPQRIKDYVLYDYLVDLRDVNMAWAKQAPSKPIEIMYDHASNQISKAIAHAEKQYFVYTWINKGVKGTYKSFLSFMDDSDSFLTVLRQEIQDMRESTIDLFSNIVKSWKLF